MSLRQDETISVRRSFLKSNIKDNSLCSIPDVSTPFSAPVNHHMLLSMGRLRYFLPDRHVTPLLRLVALLNKF